MATEPMKFLSERKLSELAGNIAANRDRYAAGDFSDLEHDNGWAIETTKVTIDLDVLATLDGSVRTAAADIENSLILYKALKGMTPALARERSAYGRASLISSVLAIPVPGGSAGILVNSLTPKSNCTCSPRA